MTKNDYKTLAMVFGPFYEARWLNEVQSDYLVFKMIQALTKTLAEKDPKFDPLKFLEIMRKSK